LFVELTPIDSLNVTLINKPKSIFPKMPQEVFGLWIAPHISVYGWPFVSVKDSLSGTSWQSFFLGRSLEHWANLDWQLSSITPSETVLFADTIWRIEGIVGYCAYGRRTSQSNIHETEKRFLACASFIKEHRKFPCPIVGIARPDCIELIDGHHRMAALLYLGGPKGTPIPTWIASKNKLER
jgi:hypothetical protein